MIVAGFELTSETRRPSCCSDLDRLGARVVELAGLADDDRPRADHQDRADRGVPGHRLAPASRARAHHRDELARTGSGCRAGPGSPRGGTAPRSPGSSRWRKPSTVPSFRLMCVSTMLGLLEQLRVDREAVVLRGDLDLAGLEVHDRMVRAAVAELELEGLAAAGEAEDLVAEADAEDRQPCRRTPSPPRSRRCTGSGSPGPFERKTPSGSSASTSCGAWSWRAPPSRRSRRPPGCAGCCASCRSRRRRRGSALAWRGDGLALEHRHQIAARAAPPGSKAHGFAQVTSRARSSPIIEREAARLAPPATSRSGSSVEMTPRLAPWVRRCRVSARVSISLIPTIAVARRGSGASSPERATTRPRARPRARRSPPPAAAPTRRPRG